MKAADVKHFALKAYVWNDEISAMRGSRLILVKVVLFQLRGCGHPQDRAMPNFFPDSKSSILGLSNEVSFVTEYFWKDGENQENIIPL